jgi:aspartate oxidase
MSEEDILVSLKEHNYDIVKVVRAYIKDGKTTQPEEAADTVNKTTTQSVNQMRFNEIRNFMDQAADSFRRNQEMNRIYQQVMEKKKAHAAAAAAASAASASGAADSHEMTNSKL